MLNHPHPSRNRLDPNERYRCCPGSIRGRCRRPGTGRLLQGLCVRGPSVTTLVAPRARDAQDPFNLSINNDITKSNINDLIGSITSTTSSGAEPGVAGAAGGDRRAVLPALRPRAALQVRWRRRSVGSLWKLKMEEENSASKIPHEADLSNATQRNHHYYRQRPATRSTTAPTLRSGARRAPWPTPRSGSSRRRSSSKYAPYDHANPTHTHTAGHTQAVQSLVRVLSIPLH